MCVLLHFAAEIGPVRGACGENSCTRRSTMWHLKFNFDDDCAMIRVDHLITDFPTGNARKESNRNQSEVYEALMYHAFSCCEKGWVVTSVQKMQVYSGQEIADYCSSPIDSFRAPQGIVPIKVSTHQQLRTSASYGSFKI